MALTPGSRLGAYEILDLLGSGGMGQVFRARDTRLDREVAIKVLPDEMARDAASMARFEREAKAVARLSHPNILAIHDYSNDSGILYAVTELLQGQTLRDRLSGALSIDDAVGVAIAIAEGLTAAHERGVIHRDLKPENIFITTDSRVKILDFGLALTWFAPATTDDTTTEPLRTTPGTILGTAGYMSPEQIRGENVTEATDLFAFGCVLYEMLSGARPFDGRSTMATLAAVLTDDPPPLPSRIPEPLRRITLRCLARDPSARFRSAHDLLFALKNSDRIDSGARPSAKTAGDHSTVKRLIVLPFRSLRPDPDIDFLRVSLPDAVTSSLTALDSLIVRSTVIATRFDAEHLDLRMVAEETGVDWLITGTLLRAGEQLRVTAQLVEAASGSVLWSHRVETSVHDIFRVQDDLTDKIVGSMAVAPTDSEQRNLRRDRPASALAYELFLRANQQGHGASEWIISRDLYLRSIEEDPLFAPAHARLGRIYWLLAKYTEGAEENWALAEQSLRRALELNPELPLAHRLHAELETDLGRGVDALERLLERIRVRPNDPELWMALVKAARYCGLLDESLEAHRRGRELDPKIASSVAHTYIMRDEYDMAWEVMEKRGDIGYIEPLILMLRGDRETALHRVRQNLHRITDVRLRAYVDSLRCALEGNGAGVRAAADRVRSIRDPEALFYVARSLIFAGETEPGLSMLATAIPGFSCVRMLERDTWLDPIRSDPRFSCLLESARATAGDAARRYARHSSFI